MVIVSLFNPIDFIVKFIVFQQEFLPDALETKINTKPNIFLLSSLKKKKNQIVLKDLINDDRSLHTLPGLFKHNVRRILQRKQEESAARSQAVSPGRVVAQADGEWRKMCSLQWKQTIPLESIADPCTCHTKE